MLTFAPKPAYVDGRGFCYPVDASSTRTRKLFAYATIFEEISSWQATIRALEKRIIECKQALLDWRSYHNSLSDISRLPDEILLEIWKYLAFNSNRVSMRWLGVTHVCSRWRRVALNCPVLWSWPPLHRPKVASLLLRRAKASRLTLILNTEDLYRYSSYKRAIQLACSTLPRTESLFLRLPSYGTEQYTVARVRKFLAKLRQGDATHSLRALDLSYSQCPDSEVGHDDLDVFEVLQRSPQLKSIILVNRNPFDSRLKPSSSISGLTSLDIQIRGTNYQLTSMRRVIQFLRYLPNLQTLTLFSIFKPLDVDDVSFHETLHSPVLFSSLRNLWLDASVQLSHLFLDSIRYPSTALLELQGLCDDATGHSPQIESLRGLLAVTTRRIAPSIRRLGLELIEDTGDWFFSCSRCENRPYISELRIFIPPTLHQLEAISDLPSLCPLDNLYYLLYDLPSSNMEMWKSYGSISTLRYLKLDLDQHPTFLKVYASLRPSGDTVFEPSAFSYPSHSGQDLNATESLYYNNAGFVLTCLVDSLLDWWRVGEERRRIANARQVWLNHSQSY